MRKGSLWPGIKVVRRFGSRHAKIAIVLSLIAVFQVVPADAAPPIVSGRPISVSGASPFAEGCGVDMAGAGLGDGFEHSETEPHLAANPADPDNLIAAWMQDEYQGLVASASNDGGRTWSTAVVPGTSTCSDGPYDLAADAAVSIGPNGTAYLVGFSLDLHDPQVPIPHRTRLFVSTSRGGFQWTEPVEITGGEAFIHDKPAITAHPSAPCVAYVVWTEGTTALGPLSQGLYLSRTDDCGATWSEPEAVIVPLPPGFAHGAELLVLPDSSLVVIASLLPSVATGQERLPDYPFTKIITIRSDDGGATWSQLSDGPRVPLLPFDDEESTRYCQFPGCRDKVLTAGHYVSADVGPDGSLYAAWRHGISEGMTEIHVGRSDDAGRTWRAESVVSAPGTQTFLPTLAVNDGGTVGVTYYDIRRDNLGDQELTTDLWFARSDDRGSTWDEDHLAGPFDLRSAPYRRVPVEGYFVGDYHGMAKTPHGFGAAFALAEPQSTVGAADIFFVPISLPPFGQTGKKR